jgi:hypothetical protein
LSHFSHKKYLKFSYKAFNFKIIKGGFKKSIFYKKGTIAYDGRVNQSYTSNGYKRDNQGYIADDSLTMSFAGESAEFSFTLGPNFYAKVYRASKQSNAQINLFFEGRCVVAIEN